jgi:hypothetical protein
VALALVAALIATAVGGSGFGSLDKKQPTAAAPVSNSSDVADQSQPPTEVVPTDTPIDEATVEQPTDVPTDTPVEEAPVETPTDVPVVPTDTPVDEAPTDVPPADTQ